MPPSPFGGGGGAQQIFQVQKKFQQMFQTKKKFFVNGYRGMGDKQSCLSIISRGGNLKVFMLKIFIEGVGLIFTHTEI